MGPPLVVRIGKRLDQLFQPGFGIPKYGLAVANKEVVEVEVQERAHAAPKASRVIHYAFWQKPAPARRVPVVRHACGDRAVAGPCPRACRRRDCVPPRA